MAESVFVTILEKDSWVSIKTWQMRLNNQLSFWLTATLNGCVYKRQRTNPAWSLHVCCLDRNTNCSYSFCLPGRTGSRSDVHKPIYGPGSEERPLHLSHLQMCCFVKAFCFEMWKVETEKLHTCTTITKKKAATRVDSSGLWNTATGLRSVRWKISCFTYRFKTEY